MHDYMIYKCTLKLQAFLAVNSLLYDIICSMTYVLRPRIENPWTEVACNTITIVLNKSHFCVSNVISAEDSITDTYYL